MPEEKNALDSENTEQKNAGEPTPSKKEGDVTDVNTKEINQEKPEMVSKAEAQKRIDKMYARMKNAQAENTKLKTRQAIQQPAQPIAQTDEFGDIIPESKPGLTSDDVRSIYANERETERAKDSERGVLMRHPSAINPDGTWNMNDLFAQKYLQVGYENPYLANGTKGPELAEAMAEKELGVGYRQGRIDEALNVDNSNNAFTPVSSVEVKSGRKVELSIEEKQEASKHGILPDEYAKYKGKKTVVSQKNWEVN